MTASPCFMTIPSSPYQDLTSMGGLQVRLLHPQILVSDVGLISAAQCAGSHIFLASSNPKIVLPFIERSEGPQTIVLPQKAVNKTFATTKHGLQSADALTKGVGDALAVVEMMVLAQSARLVTFLGSTFASAAALLGTLSVYDEDCVQEHSHQPYDICWMFQMNCIHAENPSALLWPRPKKLDHRFYGCQGDVRLPYGMSCCQTMSFGECLAARYAKTHQAPAKSSALKVGG